MCIKTSHARPLNCHDCQSYGECRALIGVLYDRGGRGSVMTVSLVPPQGIVAQDREDFREFPPRARLQLYR